MFIFLFLIQFAHSEILINNFYFLPQNDIEDQATLFDQFGLVSRPAQSEIELTPPAGVGAEINFVQISAEQFYAANASHNQPLKSDARIAFYSLEHESEECNHQELFTTVNQTLVNLNSEIPVESNFIWTQFRPDVNHDSYDV